MKVPEHSINCKQLNIMVGFHQYAHVYSWDKKEDTVSELHPIC